MPVYLHEDLAGGPRRMERRRQGSDHATTSRPTAIGPCFGARGDVFTVPAKYGNTRNLTQTSGVHERNAVWSPDGKWIAYVSDATDEDEIYIMPAGRQRPGHGS